MEETTRNSPWMNLATEQEVEENDINFDVDKKFKFRMPTGENYKGKDVKFNVQLPKDLLGNQPAAPTPAPQPKRRAARAPARRQRRAP